MIVEAVIFVVVLIFLLEFFKKDKNLTPGKYKIHFSINHNSSENFNKLELKFIKFI